MTGGTPTAVKSAPWYLPGKARHIPELPQDQTPPCGTSVKHDAGISKAWSTLIVVHITIGFTGEVERWPSATEMHDPMFSPVMNSGYPHDEKRPDTEIGWAQGLLSDGRPWLASILEDDEGDRTLSISYPALAHEEENESILINQLIAESLLVPLVDEIEFVVVEKRDDLFSSEPIWMIEVLLRNADHEWARPAFTVRELSEYRLH